MKQLEKWKKTHEKGKFRFILSGIVFWGFIGVVFNSLFDYIFEFCFNDTPNYPHKSKYFVLQILFRLFIFSLAGFLINWFSWNHNEKEFFQNLEVK